MKKRHFREKEIKAYQTIKQISVLQYVVSRSSKTLIHSQKKIYHHRLRFQSWDETRDKNLLNGAGRDSITMRKVSNMSTTTYGCIQWLKNPILWVRLKSLRLINFLLGFGASHKKSLNLKSLKLTTFFSYRQVIIRYF